MTEEKTSDNNEAPRDGVPAPLLDNLHHANEQFRKAREHVTRANEALVNPLEERQRASQEVREAEAAVEKVEEEIGKELGKK